MPKITFIIPSLNAGGAEHQTVKQIKELINRGIEIQLIVLSNNLELATELPKGVLFHCVNNPNLNTLSKNTLLATLKNRSKVIKIVRKFNPTDIIAILPTAHLIARLISGKIPHTTIWIYHRSTEYAISPIIGLKRKLFHYVNQKLFSKSSERHLYISKAVEQDIEANEKDK